MANVIMKKINIGDGNDYYPLPIVDSSHEGMVLKVVDGEWSPAEMVSGPKLIEFTVRGTVSTTVTTLQAEEGMTWAEWCDSEYNTKNYIIDNDYLMTGTQGNNIKLNNITVRGTDVIVSGGSYIINDAGAGNQ